jgi:hypothetical protein
MIISDISMRKIKGAIYMTVMTMTRYLERKDEFGSNIIDCKDYTIPWLQKCLVSIDEKYYEEIADAIRSVGNDKINAVKLSEFKYVVDNQDVSLRYLSTGEFIFMLGEISTILDIPIVIINYLSQLSIRNIDIFIEKYNKSNIVAVFDDGKREDFINMLGDGVTWYD